MIGVNKAILIGNLGKDPELRYTPGGKAAVSFSVATTEKWKDRSGEYQERTEWHNIVAWDKLAELCNQYLKKGRTCYVEGKITYRSWDDKDGKKCYKTEVIAREVKFIGGQSGSNFDQSNSFTNDQESTFGEDDLPF